MNRHKLEKIGNYSKKNPLPSPYQSSKEQMNVNQNAHLPTGESGHWMAHRGVNCFFLSNNRQKLFLEALKIFFHSERSVVEPFEAIHR